MSKQLTVQGNILRGLIQRIESYGFTCQGGPLENCTEWLAIKGAVAGDYASEGRVTAQCENCKIVGTLGYSCNACGHIFGMPINKETDDRSLCRVCKAPLDPSKPLVNGAMVCGYCGAATAPVPHFRKPETDDNEFLDGSARILSIMQAIEDEFEVKVWSNERVEAIYKPHAAKLICRLRDDLINLNAAFEKNMRVMLPQYREALKVLDDYYRNHRGNAFASMSPIDQQVREAIAHLERTLAEKSQYETREKRFGSENTWQRVQEAENGKTEALTLLKQCLDEAKKAGFELVKVDTNCEQDVWESLGEIRNKIGAGQDVFEFKNVRAEQILKSFQEAVMAVHASVFKAIEVVGTYHR